jgi:hypothetical protein
MNERNGGRVRVSEIKGAGFGKQRGFGNVGRRHQTLCLVRLKSSQLRSSRSGKVFLIHGALAGLLQVPSPTSMSKMEPKPTYRALSSSSLVTCLLRPARLSGGFQTSNESV